MRRRNASNSWKLNNRQGEAYPDQNDSENGQDPIRPNLELNCGYMIALSEKVINVHTSQQINRNHASYRQK